MKKGCFVLIIGILCLFTACEPDINLTGNYKQITITYGILNPNDSVQYIKIYKGFLIDGDARIAAMNNDSISFYKDINVTLEEYNNGNQLMKTIVLDTTTSVPVDSGNFAYPTRVLYYTTEKINEGSLYKLRIYNKKTKKTITAETYSIAAPVIENPSPYPGSGTFAPFNINYDGTYGPYNFKLAQKEHVGGYSVKMFFYYMEVNNGSHTEIHKVITRDFTGLYSRNATISMVPKQIYQTIASALSPNNSITRYTDGYGCIAFEVWAASDEFITYMDINAPSSSVGQNARIYTNMVSDDNSAYGIFASRSYTKRYYMLSPSNHCEDTLVKGQLTGSLNFDYYHNY